MGRPKSLHEKKASFNATAAHSAARALKHKRNYLRLVKKDKLQREGPSFSTHDNDSNDPTAPAPAPAASRASAGPFQMALAAQKTKKEAAEIAKMEAAQRLAQRTKDLEQAKRQRAAKTKQLTKRTARGQPVMGLQVKHVLDKLLTAQKKPRA